MRAENYKLDIVVDGRVIACFSFNDVELVLSQMDGEEYVKTITIKGRPRETLHTRDQGEITMLDSEYKFAEPVRIYQKELTISTRV